MKQTYISSVSSDNLSKENICGWIINPLLMQKWGEAPHFFLADLTSYRGDLERYRIQKMKTDSKSACFRNTMSSLHIVTAALFGHSDLLLRTVITLVLKMIEFFLNQYSG